MIVGGLFAPISHSRIPTAESVVIGQSPNSKNNSEITRQPLVQINTLEQVANLPADERAKYFREIQEQTTARQKAKIVDILA